MILPYDYDGRENQRGHEAWGGVKIRGRLRQHRKRKGRGEKLRTGQSCYRENSHT